MASLNLSCNFFGDIGGSFISKCFQTIDDLELTQCGLTDRFVEDLSRELLNHNISASMNRMLRPRLGT